MVPQDDENEKSPEKSKHKLEIKLENNPKQEFIQKHIISFYAQYLKKVFINI